MTRSIVFVHGAFVTPLCWDRFIPYFESLGYRCLAPAWPGHAAPVAELQAAPAPDLAGLGIAEIVDHHAAILEELDEEPLLVGHSFGGLIVQLLLSRGLGAAGVAIDSAPPDGVQRFYPSSLRSTLPLVARWRATRRPAELTFEQFRYAFVNTLPEEAQREAYSRYVVPETGRIFVQAALAMLDPASPLTVDFSKPDRAPLLLIAGEKDHIVPPRTNRSNHRRYAASPARTDFHEFPGRCHWIIGQEGWEEVAGYVAGWLDSLSTSRRAA